MIESTFKQFVKTTNFRLIFFVWVGLFISVHGFAHTHWNEAFVRVARSNNGGFIVITTVVYAYSYGPKIGPGFLEECTFEASVNGRIYDVLMEIRVPRQKSPRNTIVDFKSKLDKASLSFTENVITPLGVGSAWPDYLSSNIRVVVPNNGLVAVVGIGWELKSEFRSMSYIRISGKWRIPGLNPDIFYGIVYNLNISNQSALISNTPDTIKKETELDNVNILKDSEAIVIKGAELGANIKVYNAAGVEVQSTVSKSDAVQIKLPKNQLYFVNVGQARYKVAM